MKPLIKICLAITLSAQALAATPVVPSYYVPIQIDRRTETANSLNFEIPVVPKNGFQKGQVYFFYEGDRYFSAENAGTDSNGKSLWTHFDPMPAPNQGDRDYVSIRPGKSATSEASSEPSPNVASPQQGNSPGYFGSGAHQAGMGAAIRSGIATGLYKALVDTPEYNEKMAELNQRTAKANAETAANYDQVAKAMTSMSKKVEQAMSDLKTYFSQRAPSTSEEPWEWASSLQYKSTDDELLTNLKRLQGLFDSLRSTEPSQQAARIWGYVMIEQSDYYSAAGDKESAHAFYRYAEAFLDLAVGIDPVTGMLRDMWEGATGLNAITGEPLDDVSRGLALLGVATFGYGSKIGKGVRILNRMYGSDGKKIKMFKKILPLAPSLGAIQGSEKIAAHMDKRFRSSSNRAPYQQYLTELRTKMGRPVVQDPALKNFIEKRFWKETSDVVGSGGTTAAIRYERLTGQSAKGRSHIESGHASVTAIQSWLQRNPNASASDRRAAGTVLDDLLGALEQPL